MIGWIRMGLLALWAAVNLLFLPVVLIAEKFGDWLMDGEDD
jgi:hypothetical protein